MATKALFKTSQGCIYSTETTVHGACFFHSLVAGRKELVLARPVALAGSSGPIPELPHTFGSKCETRRDQSGQV